MNTNDDIDPRLVQDDILLQSIKAHMPELVELRADFAKFHEDRVYRFYHQSCKVFVLQEFTIRAHAVFLKIGGGRPLNAWFEIIVSQGTGKSMQQDTNAHWLEQTRPILEAFFHAKYFVDMMVEYGTKLESATPYLPSGWAAILEVYNQR